MYDRVFIIQGRTFRVGEPCLVRAAAGGWLAAEVQEPADMFGVTVRLLGGWWDGHTESAPPGVVLLLSENFAPGR